jgi:predicted molibdopterin-dependent oxidoreductase YjgC/Pyruvate/2-oxoacid:ferredoxin oxidoreductase delta subunit
MVTIKINGKTVKAEKGRTILEVAKAHGINIPTLCSHDALKPYGACRLCIVEITKNKRTTVDTSCTYPVEEGLTVKTNTLRLIEGRKLNLELLLARCPSVPAIKRLASEYGVKDVPPEMKKEMDECILCGLCVRACSEVVRAGAIQFVKTGLSRIVDSPFHKPAEDCIACGSCVFICPTGVIKKKDEQQAPAGPKRQIDNWQVEHKLRECKKCGNPFAPEPHLEKVRQEKNLPIEFFNLCQSCRQYPVVDEDKCLGCGGCMENCPMGALELDDKGGYDKRAKVYTQNCTACHSCEPICPVQAIS